MENFTALIIDDETDICFLLGNVLRQKNYEVIYSNTLEDGRSKLASSKPQVLFLDIHLPDGSAMREIKSIRKNFPQLKIIIMSSDDGTTERKLALKEGANYFLSKPLSLDGIEKSINKLFEKK